MHRGLSSKVCLHFLLIWVLLWSGHAMAAKVTTVKGKKVVIKLTAKEKGKVMVGDTLKVSSKGKTTGSVKVKKVKGSKVLAIVKSGKVRKGYSAKVSTTEKSKAVTEETNYEEGNVVTESTTKSRKDLLFGVLGGYGLASQSVNQQANGTSEQSGTSMAVKGIVDYSLFEEIGVRAQIGAELFSITGEGQNFQTNLPGPIGTEITYLSIDILLRYRFMVTSSLFGFANGGIGIFQPLSQSSTSLDEASISTTSIIILGGGIGLPMGGMDVFVGLDYYYFPPSEDVSTTVLSAKLGLIFGI